MDSDRLTVDFAERSNHDINKILALNVREYGKSDVIATRADFEWRCDHNPAGPAVIPVIRNRQGGVVGFIFIEPVKMRIMDQTCSVATGTNLVIQSDYRNTFGYVKLIRKFEQTLRNEGISLHFSFISEDYYQRLRAAANRSVCTIPLLIKPLNIRALTEAYFKGKWQRLFGSQVSWLLAPFILKNPFKHCPKGVAIRTVENFDTEFDEFWQQTKDKYSAWVVRDRSYLSWRFAPASNRKYYTFAAYRGDLMLGYAIVRCAILRGVQTGIILDFLVGDHPFEIDIGVCLMSHIEAFFRTHGMSISTGLMVSGAIEYQIMKKSGYRPLPAAISPRPYRFAFFVHNPFLQGSESLSIDDWFVTFADFESH